MRIQLTLDTKEQNINILYNGYNIIATTLYNEELTQKIFEMLKTAVEDENGIEIKNEKDFEKLLEIKL